MTLVAALALTLGLVLGLGVGYLRGVRAEARRRAVAGLNARIGRIWPTELPSRSDADIIAGIIRVVLGGNTYLLPVLPRNASRHWLEGLDASFGQMLADLNDADDLGAGIQRILGYTDEMYASLAAYDQSGVLPPKAEVDDFATDAEIFRALVEVWRAANPLVATMAGLTARRTNTDSPEPPSSSPESSAGIQDIWSPVSPTSN